MGQSADNQEVFNYASEPFGVNVIYTENYRSIVRIQDLLQELVCYEPEVVPTLPPGKYNKY